MRNIVYVDGFNLHKRALKPLGMQWLDIRKYFGRLLVNQTIVSIKYFTAELEGSERQGHLRYLDFLNTLERVEIIPGKHQTQFLDCKVNKCRFDGDKRYYFFKEKRTDVNIAIHMVKDSLKDECDQIVLISGDSDLIPAIKMVKDIGKKIVVYIPVEDDSKFNDKDEMISASGNGKNLPVSSFSKCQFNATIPSKSGEPIEKHPSW